jgi:rhamnosyl/mannosyltransferase
MRILHFYKSTFPDSTGGIEQLIDQLARGASALGAEIDVLSLSDRPGPPQRFNGYMLHRARLSLELASTGFSLSAIPIFARLAQQADVINYHFPWPYMDLVHFLNRPGKPTVLTYHSDIIRQKALLQLYKPLRWCFLNAVDRIVATSPNYLATSEVLVPRRGKVRVIPIGLDEKSYPPPCPLKIQSWRKRLGPKYFAFVGVLRYYKGLHVLLEAARGTSFPVAIAGAGPLEAELKRKARQQGLTNSHFLGYLDDAEKMSLIAGGLAIVFPSHLRTEAFGISLLEGAMSGKPLISSEIGTGTTFVNVNDETGLVVPPSDPAALREAMVTLWNDPNRAEDMGRRAGDRYRRMFTADRMVRSYLDLYAELLNSPPR